MIMSNVCNNCNNNGVASFTEAAVIKSEVHCFNAACTLQVMLWALCSTEQPKPFRFSRMA